MASSKHFVLFVCQKNASIMAICETMIVFPSQRHQETTHCADSNSEHITIGVEFQRYEIAILPGFLERRTIVY